MTFGIVGQTAIQFAVHHSLQLWFLIPAMESTKSLEVVTILFLEIYWHYLLYISTQWRQDSSVSLSCLLSSANIAYKVICLWGVSFRWQQPKSTDIPVSALESSIIFSAFHMFHQQSSLEYSSHSDINYRLIGMVTAAVKSFRKIWNYCGTVSSQNIVQSHIFSDIT